jgi:uncharacterized protein (TIGR04255 family)
MESWISWFNAMKNKLNQRKLSNAPIAEALLDIQVKLPDGFEYERLAEFQASIEERYPKRRVRKEWQAQLKVESDELSSQHTGTTVGFLFVSQDDLQVAQARVNGFSFSRLQPYNNWEAFSQEAKQLWNLYVKVASPQSISRIALRYINRIPLPFPVADFKDYVRTVPCISSDVSSGITNFFMQVATPVPEYDANVTITETLESVVNEGKTLPLILDIDVSQSGSFEPNSENLWVAFERLRELKNSFFFSSITSKTEELFK